MYPDFDEGLDDQATKKRLRVFEKKSLKQKYTNVNSTFFMIN